MLMEKKSSLGEGALNRERMPFFCTQLLGARTHQPSPAKLRGPGSHLGALIKSSCGTNRAAIVNVLFTNGKAAPKGGLVPRGRARLCLPLRP